MVWHQSSMPVGGFIFYFVGSNNFEAKDKRLGQLLGGFRAALSDPLWVQKTEGSEELQQIISGSAQWGFIQREFQSSLFRRQQCSSDLRAPLGWWSHHLRSEHCCPWLYNLLLEKLYSKLDSNQPNHTDFFPPLGHYEYKTFKGRQQHREAKNRRRLVSDEAPGKDCAGLICLCIPSM